MAKKQFKAESKRLLDLMVNSIYTHKEIFLREIISNASDAIDKLCYVSLTDDQVGLRREDFRITVSVDKDARTLTVSDNGIGMDREELENNLGVIASSGSYKFRRENEKTEDIDIIGQFGVGFYSAFMVADEITVRTKKYGSDQAYCWVSSGADGYTVTECEKDTVGTDVIMHIKPDGEEEQFGEYLEVYRLHELVKKYSDYIRYPIRMTMPQTRRKEGSSDEKPEYETVQEETTVNSMVPLWQRRRSEVTDEEYAKFYQNIAHDYEAPQRVITASVEGAATYKALLFIPARRPMDYGTADFEPGVQLYSAGVMIMDKCEALLPDYLRFVRGVVDSPDLSLNISRELLQHDRQLKVIGANLEKKVRAELEKLLREDRAGYEKFYENFGRAISYGIVSEGGEMRKDALQDLLLFYSSTEKKPVTLREYVDRMREEQKCIYYAAGESVALLDRMPQTELLKEKNYEILYCTGQADEFVMQALGKYADKDLRSALNGEIESGDEETVPEENDALVQFVRDTLGDRVKEVRLSRRLKTHPVCMTAGTGLSFEMEKYFSNFDSPMPLKADRILELNAKHPGVAALAEAITADPEKAKTYTEILYNQALLIAGLPLEDPSGYTDLVSGLMK